MMRRLAASQDISSFGRCRPNCIRLFLPTMFTSGTRPPEMPRSRTSRICSVGMRSSFHPHRHLLETVMDRGEASTLVIPRAIMLTAGLSFLGLGVMPPTAEWGNMLQNSLRWAAQGPHLVVFPGLALLLVVFGFNTFGDGLRVSLDPRMRNR